MNDSLFPWPENDFSWLHDIASHMRETILPITEALKDIRTIVRPIVEAVEQFKPKITEIGQVFGQAARVLLAIKKMGEAQYVYWDYLTPDFIDAIFEAKNVNKLLREHMIRDRFQTVNETINKTLAFPQMCKHQRLYIQSVNAFRSGDSDLAVTGFTSVFDGLLADISKNPTSKLKPRIETIKEKLEIEDVLNHDEYAMLTLAVTFEKTVDSFSAFSRFAGKEPKGLNRHWIAHGRSTKKRTKLDCVKMINLIYGLLLIEALDSKAEE